MNGQCVEWSVGSSAGGRSPRAGCRARAGSRSRRAASRASVSSRASPSSERAQARQVVGEVDPVLGCLQVTSPRGIRLRRPAGEIEIELAAGRAGQRSGPLREAHGIHRLSARRETSFVCVSARGLRREVLDGAGDLPWSAVSFSGAPADERRGLGRVDRRVDDQQRDVDAALAQLLCRGEHERAGGRCAGAPQALAGQRAAGGAARDLDQRAARRDRLHALAEEHERLLGDRGGPAAEVLDVGVGEVATAERALPGRPRGADRVDDQVQPAEALARRGEHRAQLLGGGSLASGAQVGRGARDGGAGPAGVRWCSRIAPPRLRAPRTTRTGMSSIVSGAHPRLDRELRYERARHGRERV